MSLCPADPWPAASHCSWPHVLRGVGVRPTLLPTGGCPRPAPSPLCWARFSPQARDLLTDVTYPFPCPPME